MLLLWLVLSTAPATDAGTQPPNPKHTVSQAACQTVAECWMDEAGKPIARPKKLRGKALPRGNCGNRLLWLRNRLACEENLCAVTFIGDKC